jgi:hypothetical protein
MLAGAADLQKVIQILVRVTGVDFTILQNRNDQAASESLPKLIANRPKGEPLRV